MFGYCSAIAHLTLIGFRDFSGQWDCLSLKEFSWAIFIFALLTTIAFQVLSNFANDYGDGVKGTDNDQRLGPKRVLQQGLLTRAALKRGIQLTAVISCCLLQLLIYLAFGSADWEKALFFIALGVASIIAAIKYTVGDAAYGYYALGEAFCLFLFWGSKCFRILLFTDPNIRYASNFTCCKHRTTKYCGIKSQ